MLVIYFYDSNRIAFSYQCDKCISLEMSVGENFEPWPLTSLSKLDSVPNAIGDQYLCGLLKWLDKTFCHDHVHRDFLKLDDQSTRPRFT